MALLRAAILIVSDTASADPSTDKTAPVLAATFAELGAKIWDQPRVQIVPDSIEHIQRAIKSWTDPGSDSSSSSKDASSKTNTNGNDEIPLANLILTTGGTGFSTRDWTPEAVKPLLHREAPGLVHGMLKASFDVTPFAMMSRPVAGVRHQSLIITLPGSPKGAKENLQAVIRLLPHACKQAAGENSRQAHEGGVKKLEKDAGLATATATASASASSSRTSPSPLPIRNAAAVSAAHTQQSHHDHHRHDHDHDHGHKIPRPRTAAGAAIAAGAAGATQSTPQSNDPQLGATARARNSPYPLLSVADAVRKIWEHCPAPVVEMKEMSSDLVGRVVAKDIEAAEAVPAYRASIVDGYAVIVPEKGAEDGDDDEDGQDEKQKKQPSLSGVYPVASVSHAQATSMPPPLKAGEIARITTGAPLPEGANAVVMVEDTEISATTEDGKEEQEVRILTDELEVGENVREAGSDIKLGETIIKLGMRITSIGGEIGVLAAAGIKRVPVYAQPRVGVLSTGDEVVDISYEGPLRGGMIRDSNRPSLLSLIRGWGLCDEVVDLQIARDTPSRELEEKLREGFRIHDLDVIVTTGGVSMGELDLLKPTIERSMGGTVHFGRVSMKPGKPTTFATVPFKESSSSRRGGGGGRSERLIFGLPGNPASAIVTANLFLLPCLQRINGLEGLGLEKVVVWTTTSRIKCNPSRVEYHRVVVSVDEKDGTLVARSTGMQRSSRVGSLTSANGLLILPQKQGYVEAGQSCEALLLGPLLGF